MYKVFFRYRAAAVGIVLLISQLAGGVSVAAQDMVFSQVMFSQLYFNPAFAGITPYPRLTSGYRNQWPGINNAYVSYYVTYDQYVKALAGGIGIGLSRDGQGNAFSKNTVDVMYSYPIELTRDVNLNLGLQASLVQKKLDASGLSLPDQDPYQSVGAQEYIPSESLLYSDFSAGASFFIKEQYQVNLAVHHITKPNEGAGSEIYRTPRRFTVQLFGQYPAPKVRYGSEKILFQPGLMAQFQKTYNFLSWGANVVYSSFRGGVWTRNSLDLKFNTVVLLAGYSNSGLSINYSYDLWMPKTYQQVGNYGAHEVTFIYLFQYNDPKKKLRIIKCPKF
ncbi:MAG: PorP/SprF family type IX secretion system membrane protein [Bacteroidota bacterium]|nr:PorP/SprF family type IX secretion system membrane protein [Bacteroidota bacterium]